MAKELITIGYKFFDIEDEPGAVYVCFSNTGIDLTNPEHQKFMDILCKVVSKQMFRAAAGDGVFEVKIKF